MAFDFLRNNSKFKSKKQPVALEEEKKNNTSSKTEYSYEELIQNAAKASQKTFTQEDFDMVSSFAKLVDEENKKTSILEDPIWSSINKDFFENSDAYYFSNTNKIKECLGNNFDIYKLYDEYQNLLRNMSDIDLWALKYSYVGMGNKNNIDNIDIKEFETTNIYKIITYHVLAKISNNEIYNDISLKDFLFMKEYDFGNLTSDLPYELSIEGYNKFKKNYFQEAIERSEEYKIFYTDYIKGKSL